MPGVESVTAMVLVGAGSRYETPETNGLSHFLEHMVFKGTQRRPSAFEISSVIDGIGADFNAATGKEETFFFVKSAKTHLPLALDVLVDMVLNPKIDAEEIEREKGVIIEEINMYEDLPMRRAPELFETLLYPNSSLGWDTAGEKEIIRKITREDFVSYRQRLYHPSNMLLVVAGGFDLEEVRRLAQEYFGSLEGKMEKPAVNEKFKQEKPQVLAKQKKTDQAHLVVGVRGNPLGHPDRYAEVILASILGGGMSSRLFIQVRERRGLAYYIKTDVEHYLDNGYLATRAGVKTEKAEEAIQVILSELQEICQTSSIADQELEKAKEFVKGRMILELEDSRHVAVLYGLQELLEEKIETPSQMIEQIDKVTKAEVARVAQEFFTNSRLNLSIVGPFEGKEKFQEILHF